MQRRKVWSTPVLYAAIVSCSLLWACGDKKEMGAKEAQAIQMVKAYTPEGVVFSVISNIEKMAEDDGRKGEKWEIPADAWKAGFPTQKDQLMEILSQYFTVFRPSGDYWVSFSYKDKSGAHQGMWDVNIYTKKIEPKNDDAKKFSKPAAS